MGLELFTVEEAGHGTLSTMAHPQGGAGLDDRMGALRDAGLGHRALVAEGFAKMVATGVYERVEKELSDRKKRLQRTLENIPKREEKARRVGVWSDDYSNLLSVFSW